MICNKCKIPLSYEDNHQRCTRCLTIIHDDLKYFNIDYGEYQVIFDDVGLSITTFTSEYEYDILYEDKNFAIEDNVTYETIYENTKRILDKYLSLEIFT
jgi:hypothetical protein